MKILFVTLFYPPTHFGGTETYTHGLARGLQRMGHAVQVLCAEDWGKGGSYWHGETDDVYDNVPVRRLHFNWTKAPEVNNYLFDNPIVAGQFERYLEEWQPDLVHVTSCQTLSASVIPTAKRAGIPVVVTLTDFWFLCPRVTLLRGDGSMCDGRVEVWECLECLLNGSKVHRLSKSFLPDSTRQNLLLELSHQPRLTRFSGLRGMALDMDARRRMLHDALEQADRVLIASQAALDLFRGAGFSMPIEIVPYGHDLEWLDAYTGKTPSRGVRFGFIGQIAPMKGPQLLIQAFRSLPRETHARLWIYGALDKHPDFVQELRALADGRTEIEFRGTYPHAESARIFSELDVLVVPSLWYDYPLIINEAFATGTPVITSDFGGMREFVQHEVNGLLFARANVQGLARQMQRVIDEPGLLERLEENMPTVPRMEQAVGAMLELYQKVVVPIHESEVLSLR